MSGESGLTEGSPRGDNNHDQSTSENNNYVVKPSTSSGDSTKFEWWKNKMYTHIISLDDEFWDILEDDINIQVNGVGMVSDRKSLTPSQKNIYRKHHRVKDILVDVLPHSEYIQIIDKSTARTIFKSLCATYEWNQQVQEANVNLLFQRYELFKTKEYEDIETMFSRFQIIFSGLQVLNKSYTTSDHVKKILWSLSIKFRSNVTTIHDAKDLNKLSLESLISNLQSHEMKLNEDEPLKKSKYLTLKSSGKSVKAPKIWKSEEVSQSEAFEEDSDNDDITFIIKRFQYLVKKNNILCGISNVLRGPSSRDNKDDQKGFFNYKKSDHFIVECPELQKDKAKKGSFQKNRFRKRFKKSLTATWDELNNEEDFEKYEEHDSLDFMALTSSEEGSGSDYSSESEDDAVFSELSRSNLITSIQDLMSRKGKTYENVNEAI
ncbi:uncharacterized protein LOC127130322 [Lathyrus oleraceus]|uniref:uncharacterized protein LOC127130322 n=1 Tax=Pisum sativum TaxID=3888 RepID=UPI0021D38BCD|nr:uncharacterized protein LOC127130322 [Pisum sativum]